MEYKPARRVFLKQHPSFSEKWLQQQIADDVALLGLGSDLDVKETERPQPSAGRLDMLLSDPATNTRYEVELQLGATDESHIIRTLEYWDNERRRFPQHDHVAVIVAEEITGRFFNVINLFNHAIPLIAIQMNALEVEGFVTLSATKVVDLALPALEEEDSPGSETDRSYWEKKSSPAILKQVDEVLAWINEETPSYELKYVKYYVGLQRGGLANNFVQFTPRRQYFIIEWRIDRTDELDDALDDSGLSVMPYDKTFRRYRAQINAGDLRKHRGFIVEFIKRARGTFIENAPADD